MKMIIKRIEPLNLTETVMYVYFLEKINKIQKKGFSVSLITIFLFVLVSSIVFLSALNILFNSKGFRIFLVNYKYSEGREKYKKKIL